MYFQYNVRKIWLKIQFVLKNDSAKKLRVNIVETRNRINYTMRWKKQVIYFNKSSDYGGFDSRLYYFIYLNIFLYVWEKLNDWKLHAKQLKSDIFKIWTTNKWIDIQKVWLIEISIGKNIKGSKKDSCHAFFVCALFFKLIDLVFLNIDSVLISVLH